MWDAFPYLGNATSAVVIFIFIKPMAIDFH